VERSGHWDEIYAAKQLGELSWTEEDPATSLRLITGFGDTAQGVVDVGAGRSPLARRLVAGGFSDVTVLDVSAVALEAACSSPGAAHAISVVVADVTRWRPERTFGTWHDRAVLHFLTEPGDVAAYVETASSALSAGGIAVIGCFAPEGPPSCSGLEVVRRDAEGLAEVFGEAFELLESEHHAHTTPWGSDQAFTWAVLRRR